MKSKESTHSKPHNWAQSGRPIQPYRLDPVHIAVDSDDAEAHDLVDATTQPYTYEPIHTAVRKLAPGAGPTFVSFATHFGLHGFAGWIASGAAQEWVSPGTFAELDHLIERYDMGFRHYTLEELLGAWNALPDDAVGLQTQALQDAFVFTARAKDDDDQAWAARGVIRRGWEADAFHIDIRLDETGATPIIYERPRHIWARAWFELLHDMQAGRFPRRCARVGCDEIFTPQRRNKRFCSVTCQNRAYDMARAKIPKRREDQAARYIKRRESERSGREPSQEPQGGDQ